MGVSFGSNRRPSRSLTSDKVYMSFWHLQILQCASVNDKSKLSRLVQPNSGYAAMVYLCDKVFDRPG